MKLLLPIFILFASFCARSQKIDSIYFHLYTDSLKKAVHNYINVDARLSNGRYLPLMTDEITFSSSAGRWEGNSIIIDSAYSRDSVVISAILNIDKQVHKSITVYIKRYEPVEKLPTEQDILNDLRRSKKKSRE